MTGPELCPKCKGLHYRNSPCIVRVKKSTAARIERAEAAGGLQTAHSPNGAATDDRLKPRKAKQQVESKDDQPSQVLPVDTFTKRPVGRPKTITDMRAYKAAKAREYRARAKNAIH